MALRFCAIMVKTQKRVTAMKNINPKKANTVFIICLVAGALLGGIGSTEGIQWMAMLGIAVMMGGLVLKVILYRCPHCGKYLDRSSGEFCPYCGKNINDK